MAIKNDRMRQIERFIEIWKLILSCVWQVDIIHGKQEHNFERTNYKIDFGVMFSWLVDLLLYEQHDFISAETNLSIIFPIALVQLIHWYISTFDVPPPGWDEFMWWFDLEDTTLFTIVSLIFARPFVMLFLIDWVNRLFIVLKQRF